MEFSASPPPGAERALRDELCDIGLKGVRLNRGGIPFHGEATDAWRACLHSRIAQRIQLLVTRFQAGSARELYDGMREVEWEHFATPRQTLAVAAVTHSKHFPHSGFAALKAKDAIVDRIRDTCGGRPDIDKTDPDVRIFLHIAETRVKAYLDLAGQPLHRRGYRATAGAAPLRETIAAAMLRFAEWDRTTPLYDPMCGAGTIAIEAALWAGNIAPGLFRKTFGFERWACFTDADADTMRTLRGEARAQAHRQIPRITASDCDPGILDVARANAASAGVRLRFRQQRIQDIQADRPLGTVVCNPPYDERIALSTAETREIAAAFSRMHGTRLCLMAGNPELAKAIPFAPRATHALKNGRIDCECLVYDVP